MPAIQQEPATDIMKFFIVNTYDRPDQKHITILKGDGLLYYIHPELEKWKGMNVASPTPIESFGIEWEIGGDLFTGKLVRESTATYHTGAVRKWQGLSSFSFIMNKHFEDPKALRAGD